MKRSLRAFRLLLFVLILVAAATLRFTHINWDQFQLTHPDERWVVMVADTMKWPEDGPIRLAEVLETAFDPVRSPFNPLRYPPNPGNPSDPQAGQPRNYSYGHFPLYLIVTAAHLVQIFATWLGETTLAFPAWMQPLHTVGRQMTSYAYLPLVGRAISALADLGTLLLVYALARRVVCHATYAREPFDCHAERVNHSNRVATADQRSISCVEATDHEGVLRLHHDESFGHALCWRD